MMVSRIRLLLAQRVRARILLLLLLQLPLRLQVVGIRARLLLPLLCLLLRRLLLKVPRNKFVGDWVGLISLGMTLRGAGLCPTTREGNSKVPPRPPPWLGGPRPRLHRTAVGSWFFVEFSFFSFFFFPNSIFLSHRCALRTDWGGFGFFGTRHLSCVFFRFAV